MIFWNNFFPLKLSFALEITQTSKWVAGTDGANCTCLTVQILALWAFTRLWIQITVCKTTDGEPLSESQVFAGSDWAPPEAVPPVTGDECCWKLGCENLYVLTFALKKFLSIPVIFLHFSSLCMPTLPLQFWLGGFFCCYSLPNQQTPWVSSVSLWAAEGERWGGRRSCGGGSRRWEPEQGLSRLRDLGKVWRRPEQLGKD